MRICYTSDLHGSLALYGQLAELLRAETPDLLILGGDLLADGEPEDPLGTQVAWLRREFIPRISAWRAAQPDLRVACVAGNHESIPASDALVEYHQAGDLVLLNQHAPWEYGGFRFLGFSYTPPTPHWLKDRERLDLPGDNIPDFPGVAWDQELRQSRPVDLQQYFRAQPTIRDELSEIPSVSDPWILVAHGPPRDSKLDRLPTVPHPIGSRAIREFIVRRQPLLSLHGHVHESPAVTGSFIDHIGNTVAINPGQDHHTLYAVTLDTDQPAQSARHTVLS